MNFRERLRLVNEILEDCPYKTQKQELIELFKNTDSRNKQDIVRRLSLIDSYYATNMSTRLFALEELADLIININNQLKNDIDVIIFIKENLNKNNLLRSIGVNKKGEPKGHAFSLITKYIYFKTAFNFPIYDKLVFDELKNENLITGVQTPSLDYFKSLIKIKNQYNKSFDDLDKYFWTCGKIRAGSLSLFISNSNSYINDFLKKLSLTNKEMSLNSAQFSNLLAQKLISKKIIFNNKKLINIQKLALSLSRENVFEPLSINCNKS
jgi:hypothetical protein